MRGTSLDVDLANEAAVHYEESTGIRCVVVTDDDTTVTPNQGCGFCHAYTAVTGEPVDCARVHRYGGAQSLRFGGRYTYTCPLSLVHFTSPLLRDGVQRGSLLAGPVLLVDPSEILEDEIAPRKGLSEDQKDRLLPALRTVPRVSTQRARALAQQLLYTASWVSGMNLQEYDRQEKRLSQQSRIAEYIQELKDLEGENESPPYPLEKERSLLRAISRGDREDAAALLNELLGILYFSTGGDFETMKTRTQELVVLLSRAAVEGGADPEGVFGLNFKALREIHEFRTVDQLNLWLARILQRFVGFVFDLQETRHREVILKGMRYIRRNHALKLTLEEVAAHVALSPTYFSRIFKEETGESFKHYVNHIRIEESRHLLKETDLSLVEIAAMVGYDDQSYFSRVFRTHVGLSPGQYRRAPERIGLDTQEIHD